MADPAPIRIVELPDAAATRAFAAKLAPLARPGDALTLSGDLGMGKTEFARGFVRARAGRDIEVPSPTFTLVQTYDLPGGEIWHFDLYRLADPEEIWELGWEAAREGAIALIEWPERLGPHLPADRLAIGLAPGAGETARIATLSGAAAWARRLEAADAP
ncbi:MAG: tRNA (adenosine(37)-N6)-threonylcarbamoyltransferase complex ATPase subunit type 1 TsaE [Azospirillum sp.]|jgi:tRNA threonylcarbamoyladenosine biosynthesis protein TsaE|nr:tRNA (adenosine(37)-N6)-threonylcarbamoyltransferase complex ATPase subunit type 1 TsaE [Azospirillum sp.]MCZ8122558.1 tRNA (adenosine(37)-N6)-threonylcarbamoyltransferase complex ATPase subunit type 1 TsaE [Magnetospirillum sp.]